MECLIQRLMPRIKLHNFFYAECFIIYIFKKRKATHFILCIKCIHLYDNILCTRIFNRNSCVSLLPIGNTLVNKRINQDSLDVGNVIAINT